MVTDTDQQKATRQSWPNLQPLPSARASLSIEREFTEAEYERLALGLIPQDMDDKWFIFLEEDVLYFYRSWTSFCVYWVRLSKEGATYSIAEAYVSRDANQYTQTSKSYDKSLLLFLINNLLLGVDHPFPTPANLPKNLPEGLYQHHISGTAFGQAASISPTDDIVIYTNKRHLIALGAGCLLLTAGCVYPLLYGYNISDRDALGRFFNAITPAIFYIGAAVFGLGLIYTCYRLIVPRPSVMVNREGVFENSSPLSAGLIRWEEIESMFIYTIMDNAFLGIVPVNLEAVLTRQSPIKRFLFRTNKGMAQAPFCISGGGLPMPVEELLSRIERYREALSQDRAEELIH